VGLLGLLAITLGGAFFLWRQPAAGVRSGLQHVAAGTIFAGLVVEVFPTLLDRGGLIIWTSLGLVFGVAAVLSARAVFDQGAAASSFVVTLIIDVIIDGGLLGIAITEGRGTRPIAVLFAIAFAPELFFLGISLAKDTGAGRLRRTLAICGTVGWSV
jgi:ZIP family zinc transporter